MAPYAVAAWMTGFCDTSFRTPSRLACILVERAAGLDIAEQNHVLKVIESNVKEWLDETLLSTDIMTFPAATDVLPGATGRVLQLLAKDLVSADECEELAVALSQALDDSLYDPETPLNQPILVSVTNDNVPPVEAILQQYVDQYRLKETIFQAKANNQQRNAMIPTAYVSMDGCYCQDPWDMNKKFLDTSSLCVFDGLVDKKLVTELRTVLLGTDWNDENGPNPEVWEQAGLTDLPSVSSDASKQSNQSFGLSQQAIDRLCNLQHPALEEFERRLALAFPDFYLTRMPEAVLGATISPLTANAPVAGQSFDWHIDADPNLAPPSPWTDVFGRYPNRARGKPRFVSCLVYLNDIWDYDNWGAPTRVIDVATDTAYEIEVKPGRVVLSTFTL
jgi:hypothetical protein